MFGFAKKDSFPRAKLFPLIGKLGEYLKIGFDHYSRLQIQGQSLPPDALSLFLLLQMKDWNPTIEDKPLLDDETKKAAARFLAGVAINLFTEKE